MEAQMTQLFEEAMHNRTMFRRLLKTYCGDKTNVMESSIDLKKLVSEAILRIRQIAISMRGGEVLDEIKETTAKLEAKLVHRWEKWEPTVQINSVKVLLKQARIISNKRPNLKEIQKELVDYFLKICDDASKEVVGFEKHVKEIMDNLERKRVVGVCGMVGIGKTTLLLALDTRIRRENPLYLVAQLDLRHQNIEELQQSILFQLYQRYPRFEVSRPENPEQGRRDLATVFKFLNNNKKKVCFILDGIPTLEFWSALFPLDLQRLLGSSSNFIVSSQNQRVIEDLSNLACSNPETEFLLYTLAPLQKGHAKDLFCAKAEAKGSLLAQNTFVDGIVDLCGGLPLALVECGTYFSIKENRPNNEKIKTQLRGTLQDTPCKEIFERLLNSIEEEILQAFVDVAMFWNGKEWKKASIAMEYEIGESLLDRLREKSLVTCDGGNPSVKVHPLMEALAIRLASQKQQVYLKNASPTGVRDKVRGISCYDRNIDLEELSVMHELRFIDFKKCGLHSSFLQPFSRYYEKNQANRHLMLTLPSTILVLNIYFFIHSPSIINIFILLIFLILLLYIYRKHSIKAISQNLTFLSISQECANTRKLIIEHLKNLPNLRYLCFSSNSQLKYLPSSLFPILKSLIYLDLSNCDSLVKLPSSISHLSLLRTLDLSGCTVLGELPDTISRLTSLEALFLSNCTQLKKLPDAIGDLKSLRSLKLSRCYTLKRLPHTFFDLQSLQNLDVSQNKKMEGMWQRVANLMALEHLNMAHNEKLQDLPAAFGNLRSLKVLNLSNCKQLKHLPDSLGKLNSLKALYLAHCDELEEIPLNSIAKIPSLEQISVPPKHREKLPPSLMAKLVPNGQESQ
ncbi:hypothetical protein GOP47_0016063 [Adiantum capillus-veneris]|uniref:Disease resistance R13L4/SHOC-2-like LRR domain-containing protein n=1 Tax=Adiantum capillus-veneris TaxID=13818 RepID=A0A9D4ULM5_ADICA|nr:hypothetical protein GOP47_0016063 [Adiantum capillus-veneris]